jgi:hypothetical protein
MTSPFALPVLGVSILAAAAAGIHLGESAVASINPIYFQGPALHPRERGAAIDERSLALARAEAPMIYGWDQGHAARAADCGDCGGLAAHDAQVYSAVVPYFGGDEPAAKPTGYSVEASVRVHRGSDENVALAEGDTGRIEFYAQHPLGYEEAAFAEPVAEELPVEEKDRFHY